MKTRELIELLQQCDPEATVIINAPFQGFVEANVLLRQAHGGLGMRMSWEEVPTVEILNGDLHHMKNQGMDVIGGKDTDLHPNPPKKPSPPKKYTAPIHPLDELKNRLRELLNIPGPLKIIFPSNLPRKVFNRHLPRIVEDPHPRTNSGKVHWGGFIFVCCGGGKIQASKSDA